MVTKLTPDQIAKVAHNVNKDYSESIGDFTQTSWEVAPADKKDSAVAGVMFHLNNPSADPKASHEAWMKNKQEAGWQYGETKSEKLKTHPCIVPYDDLPVSEKSKDYIFQAIVSQLSSL